MCLLQKCLSNKVQSVQLKNTPCCFFYYLKSMKVSFLHLFAKCLDFPFKAKWNKCINFVFISDNISHILINIWNSFPPPAKSQSWCKQLQNLSCYHCDQWVASPPSPDQSEARHIGVGIFTASLGRKGPDCYYVSFLSQVTILLTLHNSGDQVSDNTNYNLINISAITYCFPT